MGVSKTENKRQLFDREHSWSTKWDSRDFYFKAVEILLKDENFKWQSNQLNNETKQANLIISVLRKTMKFF